MYMYPVTCMPIPTCSTPCHRHGLHTNTCVLHPPPVGPMPLAPHHTSARSLCRLRPIKRPSAPSRETRHQGRGMIYASYSRADTFPMSTATGLVSQHQLSCEPSGTTAANTTSWDSTCCKSQTCRGTWYVPATLACILTLSPPCLPPKPVTINTGIVLPP